MENPNRNIGNYLGDYSVSVLMLFRKVGAF